MPLGQGPNSLSDERWDRLLSFVDREADARGFTGDFHSRLLLIKEHWMLFVDDVAVVLRLDEERYDELKALKERREDTLLPSEQAEADALATKLRRPRI